MRTHDLYPKTCPRFPHSPLLLPLPAFPFLRERTPPRTWPDHSNCAPSFSTVIYLSLFNRTMQTPKQPLKFYLGYCSYVFSGYRDIFITKKYTEKENLLRLTASSSSTHLKRETLQQDSSAGAEQRLQHQIYIIQMGVINSRWQKQTFSQLKWIFNYLCKVQQVQEQRVCTLLSLAITHQK